MRYLVIDASLHGTGIRDKYVGGYIEPDELGISSNVITRLNEWLVKYENEQYNEFHDTNIIDELDFEGKEIAVLIKSELFDVKIEYFSSARMTNDRI